MYRKIRGQELQATASGKSEKWKRPSERIKASWSKERPEFARV
jgi:hypothetical protein